MEPQSAVDAEIQKLFQGFEISAVSKIISPHASTRTQPGDHYYLFVDLVNAGDVDEAVRRLNGRLGPWGGSGRLKVNKARMDRDIKVSKEQGPLEPEQERLPAEETEERWW